MKRNIRNKKRTVFARTPGGAVVLIVLAFATGMIYWLFDANCLAMSQELGNAEKRLAAAEAELNRETARWEEFKTPERLENALARFGLEMRYPSSSQIVRMDGKGRPAPGQLSVARLRNRASTVTRVVKTNVRKK